MAPTLWGDIGLPFLVDIQYIMVQVLEVNKKERQGRRSHFMMGRSGSCFWGQWFGEVAKRPHMLQFNKCGKSDINGQVKPHRFMSLVTDRGAVGQKYMKIMKACHTTKPDSFIIKNQHRCCSMHHRVCTT
ncbi:unnamed protein product [Durusdinium trenchii]|uniref:Uncharacterized protein n=1 Tax=Durusdinium trenchii TaxID=1381693 RepID=A0ABP0LUE9_9DINO